MVKRGDPVPDVELLDENGKPVKLKELTAGTAVIYFYPKDNTPGCTREAKTFNEKIDEITAAGAKVFGISKDSVNSHQKFLTKLGLKFKLLSDPGGKAAMAFGADGQTYPKRTTFIIKDGTVIDIIYNVKPEEHPVKALESIKALAGQS